MRQRYEPDSQISNCSTDTVRLRVRLPQAAQDASNATGLVPPRPVLPTQRRRARHRGEQAPGRMELEGAVVEYVLLILIVGSLVLSLVLAAGSG